MSHLRNETALWPCNRDAIRFLVVSEVDRRGRQKIFVLFWLNGVRKSKLVEDRLEAQIRIAKLKQVANDVVFDLQLLSRAA